LSRLEVVRLTLSEVEGEAGSLMARS
jgi:hypothetical protein